MSNHFHDPQALITGSDPPGLVSRLVILIEEEELKDGTIVHAEISLLPADNSARIVVSSEAGKEIPKFVVGGKESPQSWGQRVAVALAAPFGDRPTGAVEASVWLDSKKATCRRRTVGRIGTGSPGGGGSGPLSIPGVMVSLEWAFAYAKEQCRVLWSEIHALRVHNHDLIKANTDMASRGIAVAEAVPAATASAVALVQQANGGWLGQLAQGAASVMLGGGGGGSPGLIAGPPGAGQGGPARVLYSMRDGRQQASQEASQGGQPQAPTPELLFKVLEEVGEEMALDAVALWLQAHGPAALARLKSDQKLQAAFRIPPAALAFLR